jgi:hypothetical protein
MENIIKIIYVCRSWYGYYVSPCPDYSHVWKSIDRIAPVEVIAASEVRKHNSK